MKSLSSIITFFLLFFFMPLFSKTEQDPGIALWLNKGDQLVYEIKIERSQTLTTFNNEPQVKNTEQRSRLHLKVEEIPKPGTYLFSYKKLFTKKFTTSGEEISSSDSRFPEYGHDLRAVISCYLNSVEYSVLLNTKKGEISITNLDQIRTGLTDYIKSRGIEMDEYTRRERDHFSGEELIIQHLRVLNFYPSKQGVQAWFRIQANGNKEVFNLIRESDSTYTIQSKIPDFNIAASKDGAVHAGVRIPRELTIDSKSGILLQAESLPNQTLKEIYEEGNDSYEKQMSYHYKFELLSYSKWDKPTIICGQIQGAKIERLCLEYKSFMVGNDVDHIYIEKNADGTFSIPLEIKNPVRYRLYLLESFPINTNKHVDLYIEPGDSIHVVIDQSNKTPTQFSGIGFRNSEFMNRISLDQRITSLLRVYSPRFYPPDEFFNSLERNRQSVIKTKEMLKAKRTELTPGFYSYMLSEIYSQNKMLEISEAIRNLAEKAKLKEPISYSLSDIPVPQIPYYDNLSNLENFSDYASQYTSFRFYQIFLMHKNRYGYDTRKEQMVFSRVLLEGYPLYADLVNHLEELAKRPDKRWMNYKNHFREFLEYSNNQEVTDYVRYLFKQIELLDAGNEMPRMDLIDLDGKEWDWKKTTGKIVVLMLFGNYNGLHYLCEDLYKDYGYNKKDVIILRISPGISFQHWKNFNTRYSTEMHQMYFPGGEDALNERFIPSINGWKFLIIDRNGKIFRDGDQTNIKTAIKIAIAQPLPSNKPFSETTLARILFGALLGALLSFVLYRIIIFRRLKQRSLMQKMSELEQKAMKAQLNPHFLFNSLNSIQHLIRSNQLKDADSYLSVFAALIRKILDNSEKESVPISEELETIKLYLELEQMRFEFKYEIIIDPEIDVYNTMIPTMMLQPIVENAILHGLAPRNGEKVLTIEVRIKEDFIIFKVEDNGIGRAASSKIHHAHDSKGLHIIQSRIDILNRAEPNKYNIEIVDLEDQNQNSSGTLVEISMPDEK